MSNELEIAFQSGFQKEAQSTQYHKMLRELADQLSEYGSTKVPKISDNPQAAEHLNYAMKKTDDKLNNMLNEMGYSPRS